MTSEIYLLKSVEQYIDVKGDIYEMDFNGNLDDMSNETIGHITSAPQTWWNDLSPYDIKLADIIYGGLQNGKS